MRKLNNSPSCSFRLSYLLALPLLGLIAGCKEATTQLQNAGQNLTSRPLFEAEIDISPQGNSILFSGRGQGDSGIYSLSLKTLKVQQVIDTPDFEITPSFAPDGKTIVYAAASSVSNPCRLFTCALNGTGVTQITQRPKHEENNFYDRFPAFSPDGSKIVFARAARNRPYSMGGMTWDNWDIYTVKPDGTGLNRVTNGNYYSVSPPRFFPDGKHIIFAANVAGAGTYDPATSLPSNVLWVDAQGDSQPKLLTKDDHSSAPSFAMGNGADANQVVFISDRVVHYEYELWLMNGDGKRQRQLTQTHAYNIMPRFTPDGQHIFFMHGTANELWQVDVSGSNLHQVADSTLFSDPLGWRPSR